MENQLHKYRKLEKEKSVFKFAGSNTTLYADSRLKFRRNFIYLLQKLYLLDDEEILPLIEHILKNSNTAKTCNVLSDHGFL